MPVALTHEATLIFSWLIWRLTLDPQLEFLTIDYVRELYGEADSVHDFDHILRVVALAAVIGEQEGADMTVVHAAALLHDLGRAESQANGWNHAAVAAEQAGTLLESRGADPAWQHAVCHAISAHRFREAPDPETLEAKVVFDADKLDAIGATGIARAFAYGGAHRQRLWAPLESVNLADWDQNGDNPDVHTPVHEFVVKLSRIKDRLYTPAGRRIAEARHTYMQKFFERLDAEVRGEK
ncbi:MAG: HD domain-containing protein [Anaerolineae bacterium]|nr:HD domain-containing protein [Anaerolineae bacterium]